MARWIGGVASGLTLAFLIGLGVYVSLATRIANFGTPLWMKLLFGAVLLAAVLVAPLVWVVVRSLRTSGWSLPGKVHLALLTLALVLFIPFLQYWNLLGFKCFKY